MALDLDGDISEAWSLQALFMDGGGWGGGLEFALRPQGAWLPLAHG